MNTETRTLFVSKYPPSTSLQQLKNKFEEFGNIEQVLPHGPGACIIFQSPDSGINVIYQVSSALSKQITIDGHEPYTCQFLNLDQLDPEANIFIDNLSNNETQQSLRQLLGKFGTILSIKVQKSEKNTVAYIQFEKRESAENLLSDTSLNLKISKFISKKRDQVFISNIKTNNPPDQLKQELQTFCTQFGEVESLILNRNSNNGTFFAFVKFLNHDSANAALKSTNLFNGQQITIEWTVKNNEKDIEANLFTKNLKVTVTEEQLRKAYSLIVPVEDVKLLKSKQPPINKPITQHAYLYFRTAEEGKTVIDQAYNTQEIIDLYERGVIQISPLLPPSEVNSLMQVKKNSYQRQQPPQYQYPPPQQQFPPFRQQYGYQKPNRQPYKRQQPDLYQLQGLIDRGQKQQVTDQIGTQLFPKVMQIVGPNNAPLVTGILLDFENYQLSDQLRMLSDQAFLGDNIRQALDLLK